MKVADEKTPLSDLAGIATVLCIALKLIGIIDWPWVYVLSPGLALLAGALIVVILDSIFPNRDG